MELHTGLLMGAAAQAIGWALVHFVWQGTLLVLVLALLWILPGFHTPRARYGLCFACLLGMLALPLVTGWVVYAPSSGPRVEASVGAAEAEVIPGNLAPVISSENVGSPDPLDLESGISAPTREFSPTLPPRHEVLAAMVRWESIRGILAPFVPWLVLMWLLGVFAMAWRNVASWLLAQRLCTHGVDLVPVKIGEMVLAIRVRLGIRRTVTCLQSAHISVPATIGWLKPIVLLPSSSLLGLNITQLEAILAHELAHIRRYDYLANDVWANTGSLSGPGATHDKIWAWRSPSMPLGPGRHLDCLVVRPKWSPVLC